MFSHRVVLGLPRVSTQCVLLNIYAIYRICRQYSHRLSSICLVQLHKSSKFSSVDQVIAACRLCCIYTARKDEIVFFGCFLYGQLIFCKKAVAHNTIYPLFHLENDIIPTTKAFTITKCHMARNHGWRAKNVKPLDQNRTK